MSDEDDLRKRLKQEALKLFGPSGRFNQYAEQAPDFVAACFAATPNCKSAELRDRLYWVLNDMHDYPSCQRCGKVIEVNVKNFASKLKGQRYCNAACRLSDPEQRQRYNEERLERTGYSNPLQNPEVRAKVTKTNLERYGVENVAGLSSMKAKVKQSVNDRYGADNVSQVEEFRSKRRTTNLDRYGAEYPAHTEKGRRTCLARYGVPHPMQDFRIFQKVLRSRFRIKTLVTASGAELKYQGYEDVALKLLLSMGVLEVDIMTDRADMPRVFYRSSDTNKRSRYYPDIFVRSLNLLIEVKSVWTYNLNKQQAHDKQRACQRLGYKHLIVVCDQRSIIEIIGS